MYYKGGHSLTWTVLVWRLQLPVFSQTSNRSRLYFQARLIFIARTKELHNISRYLKISFLFSVCIFWGIFSSFSRLMSFNLSWHQKTMCSGKLCKGIIYIFFIFPFVKLDSFTRVFRICNPLNEPQTTYSAYKTLPFCFELTRSNNIRESCHRGNTIRNLT